MDYAKAEEIIEANVFIIGGNMNQQTIKKINDRFEQIKEFQNLSEG